MTRRKIWVVPAVFIGLWFAGRSHTALSQEPRRLPAVIRVRAEQQQPAEEPVPAAPVQGLIEYALANNPEIRAARYHASRLGARVPQVKSLPDPKLMSTVFLESIQTAAGPQEVMLSLAQQFPFFGKRALRSQVAYHDAMAAYARLTAVELKVIEQVKRAY